MPATRQLVGVETLAEIVSAFNRHDLDAIMDFFAEDAVLETRRGPDPWGRRYVAKLAVAIEHDLARTTVPSPTEVSRRAGHLRVLPGGSYFDV